MADENNSGLLWGDGQAVDKGEVDQEDKGTCEWTWGKAWTGSYKGQGNAPSVAFALGRGTWMVHVPVARAKAKAVMALCRRLPGEARRGAALFDISQLWRRSPDDTLGRWAGMPRAARRPETSNLQATLPRSFPSSPERNNLLLLPTGPLVQAHTSFVGLNVLPFGAN